MRHHAAGTNHAGMAAAVNNSPFTIREGKAVVQRPPKKDAAGAAPKAAAAAAAAAGESMEDEPASASASADEPLLSAGGGSGVLGPDGIEVVEGEGQQEVFYNKVQVFNRDLSIVMIQTFIDERKQEWTERAEAAREKEKRRVEAKAKMAAAGTAAATSAASSVPAASSSSSPSPPPAADASADQPFPGITILEALSATGLRSIRYFRELSDVNKIIVNDMDEEALRSIEHNIALNGLTTAQLEPSHSDAITLMQKFRPPVMSPIVHERPAVIDLDPYGTAAPFLDSAVQAIDEGGLLAVTCTDKAILCGNYSEACFAKYGSMPLKGPFCHELAIRIVLNSIAQACHRYGRYMQPILSMSIDFYIRVFVRVHSSPMMVKRQAALTGMVVECTSCQSFWPHALGKIKIDGNSVKHQPAVLEVPLGAGCRCPNCDGSTKMGGPFWLGPLHEKRVVQRALARVQKDPSLWATSQRIIGSLTVCAEELQPGEAPPPNKSVVAAAAVAAAAAAAAAPTAAAASASTSSSSAAAPPAASPTASATVAVVPVEFASPILYYSLPVLFQTVNSSCPKMSLVRSGLMNAGYAVSQSHSLHNAIKTNAPTWAVWDIVRGMLALDPPKNGQKPGSAGAALMARPMRLAPDFTKVPGSDLSSQATGVPKFLPNPEDHWGPKARAGKRKVTEEEGKAKRAKTAKPGRPNGFRQCKIFASTGSCRYGETCKYAHVEGAKAGEDVSAQLAARAAAKEAAAAAAAGTEKTDAAAMQNE